MENIKCYTGIIRKEFGFFSDKSPEFYDYLYNLLSRKAILLDTNGNIEIRDFSGNSKYLEKIMNKNYTNKQSKIINVDKDNFEALYKRISLSKKLIDESKKKLIQILMGR